MSFQLPKKYYFMFKGETEWILHSCPNKFLAQQIINYSKLKNICFDVESLPESFKENQEELEKTLEILSSEERVLTKDDNKYALSSLSEDYLEQFENNSYEFFPRLRLPKNNLYNLLDSLENEIEFKYSKDYSKEKTYSFPKGLRNKTIQMFLKEKYDINIVCKPKNLHEQIEKLNLNKLFEINQLLDDNDTAQIMFFSRDPGRGAFELKLFEIPLQIQKEFYRNSEYVYASIKRFTT